MCALVRHNFFLFFGSIPPTTTDNHDIHIFEIILFQFHSPHTCERELHEWN
jgi:hypothetical protein